MDVSLLKGKPPCDICARECVERGEAKYWGGVGEFVCEKCKRRVCFLHFNFTKKLCDDCLKELNEVSDEKRPSNY